MATVMFVYLLQLPEQLCTGSYSPGTPHRGREIYSRASKCVLFFCVFTSLVFLQDSDCLGTSQDLITTATNSETTTHQQMRMRVSIVASSQAHAHVGAKEKKTLQSLFSDAALLTDSSSVGTGHFFDVEVGRSPTR